MILNKKYYINKKHDYKYLVRQNLRDAQNFSGWLMNFAPTGNLNLKFEKSLPQEDSTNLTKSFWNIDGSRIEIKDSLTFSLEARRSTPVEHLDSEWSEEELLFLINKAISDGRRNKVYKDEYIPLRSYPSGGAQYPIKIFIIVNKDMGYFKKNHSYKIHADLGMISEIDQVNFKFEEIFAISHFNKEISEETKKLSFAIVLDMNLKHSFKKYKYCSRQLAMIEAGHIGQNLQLVSTAMGKKSLPNGGILSDVTKEAIGLSDSQDDIVIYGVAF